MGRRQKFRRESTSLPQSHATGATTCRTEHAKRSTLNGLPTFVSFRWLDPANVPCGEFLLLRRLCQTGWAEVDFARWSSSSARDECQLASSPDSLGASIDFEERLVDVDRFFVVDENGYDFTGDSSRDLVEHLHGLNGTDRGRRIDMVTDFDVRI